MGTRARRPERKLGRRQWTDARTGGRMDEARRSSRPGGAQGGAGRDPAGRRRASRARRDLPGPGRAGGLRAGRAAGAPPPPPARLGPPCGNVSGVPIPFQRGRGTDAAALRLIRDDHSQKTGRVCSPCTTGSTEVIYSVTLCGVHRLPDRRCARLFSF